MQPTPPQEFFDAQERIAAKRLALVTDAAKAAGVACHAHSVEALHPGKPSSTTPRRRTLRPMVMASHGRRGVSALLLGSETQKVLTHSTVAVLVVR